MTDKKLKKQYALLFLGIGVIFAVCAIVVIPFWWLISRIFTWIEYWHVFLFMVFNMVFIEFYEWGKDYKNYKRLDSPWLIMFIFTLVYFVITLICYFIVHRVTGK